MLRFVVALAYLVAVSSAAAREYNNLGDINQRQLKDWSPSFPHYSPTASEDKPVYTPTDKKVDKPVYASTCSGKKCDAPVYVPNHSMPSEDKPVFSPVTKTSEPTQFPTHEPTIKPTTLPTLTPTNRQPTKYVPTGASVAPTPRPTNAPSENPLMPTTPTAPAPGPTLNPTQSGPTPSIPTTPEPASSPTGAPTDSGPTPIFPTTPAPTPTLTSAPTTNPTGPVEIPFPTTPAPTTDFPSELPSSAPSSTPVVVFINELGTTGGDGFVEVAYSSFLGPGIGTYSIAIINGNGSLIDDETLSEGVNSANGLTFTFITYPIADPPNDAEAFALVDNSDMAVLLFLSVGSSVTAIDGPAKGLRSVDMQSINRKLQETGGDTSFGLSGSGCDFDDFVFTEVESTPGNVNAGQEVAECKSPPTTAPTPPPTPAPTEKLDSDFPQGAIVGIAVGGSAMCLLLLILGCDFRTNRKKRAQEEPMYWEEGSIEHSEASFSDE